MRFNPVTETFLLEVNGVSMTLGCLLHGLANQGCEVQVVRPSRDFLARKSIQAGCSFKQGMASKDSPPASRNSSFPSMAISSSVSRQSDMNAGVITNRRFFPCSANWGKTRSV